jgi:ribosomal protein S18 acetylase RimI-like enzyme
MVAETVRQSGSTFRGVRPFNSTRDLGTVALLLEQAFREDLGFLHLWSRVPGLRQVGAYLWAASFAPAMPESLLGFVWEEAGRIIGNVTLTPDEMRRRHWLISNVAVDEKFRRRGIARELMLAALAEARQRGATWVILNVRPHNTGAILLYRELGFESVDTEMGYAARRAVLPGVSPLALRHLPASEYRAAFDLARAGMSERLKLFRPLRASEFGLHFEDRLAERVLDFFIGQSTERWGYYEQRTLCATVQLHAQRVGTPHSFDVRVAADRRGLLEAGLVAFALSRLAHFPRREITTRILNSHHELVEALGRAGFAETRGLMLMAKQM